MTGNKFPDMEHSAYQPKECIDDAINGWCAYVSMFTVSDRLFCFYPLRGTEQASIKVTNAQTEQTQTENKMSDLISREEAVKVAGEKLVAAAEKENCECVNSVTDGTEWAGYTPFAAQAWDDENIVKVWYLVSNEDAAEKELDQIDWEVEGYTVEEA